MSEQLQGGPLRQTTRLIFEIETTAPTGSSFISGLPVQPRLRSDDRCGAKDAPSPLPQIALDALESDVPAVA
jgi:hypothetical protein